MIHDNDTEIHTAQGFETRRYPDEIAASAAIAELNDRVRAIGAELGVHSLFVVASFDIAKQEDKTKKTPPVAEALLLYGCPDCNGVHVQMALMAAFKASKKFFYTFSEACKQHVDEMLTGFVGQQKAKQKGYDA